jgi:hypothetical protein
MALKSSKIENRLRKKSRDGKSKSSRFSEIAKKHRNKLRRSLLKNPEFIWSDNFYNDYEY